MKKNYILKKYDEEIASFQLERTEIGGYVLNIIKMEEENPNLPVGVHDGQSLSRWLRLRTIPRNRSFVADLLESHGIALNDLIGFLDVSKVLSVNDVYWVVEEGFDGSFKNNNLYEKPFSEALSHIAFTGESNHTKDTSLSPEWTTDGTLAKCWRRIDGALYLYKASTQNNVLMDIDGYEPYSEYYVSQLAEYLGIDCVSYDLQRWEGKLASVCKCFSDLNTSFVPMSRFLSHFDYESLKSLITEHYLEDKFADMILLDAITLNGDRHLNNFGFLVDNHTNQIVDFAPIFDNGLSLFANISDSALEKKFDKEYTVAKISKWFLYHDDLVKNNLTDSTVEKLKKLSGYTIQLHPKYNLDENRIMILNRMIQKRQEELLALLDHE